MNFDEELVDEDNVEGRYELHPAFLCPAFLYNLRRKTLSLPPLSAVLSALFAAFLQINCTICFLFCATDTYMSHILKDLHHFFLIIFCKQGHFFPLFRNAFFFFNNSRVCLFLYCHKLHYKSRKI